MLRIETTVTELVGELTKEVHRLKNTKTEMNREVVCNNIYALSESIKDLTEVTKSVHNA